MKRLVFTICVLTVLLGFSPTAAAEVYKLSLKEVTELALENNFQIQLAKYDAWIARTNEGVAESIYDTLLEAEVGYREDESKRTSTILGTRTTDNDYNVGLSKKLPTGTSVAMDMTNNRNTSNSSFATSSVQHESTLEVGVTQELGRNFFGLQDRGNVKITKLDIESAEYLSLDSIETDVAFVQKTYWELVQLQEFVRIEEGMVEQAKKLYDLHQEKIQDGLVELPEAIASEANYKSRLNDLTLARKNFEVKANELRLLLNIVEDDAQIVPADTFAMFDDNEDLSLSLQKAFENRQDYKAKANDVKSRNIQLSMKKNSLWPEINLSASLARNGLGDDFKDSATNITAEENPNFFAGLTISIPLENTKARAEFKGAKLQKAKALLDLKYLERTIAIDITNQVKSCNVLKEVANNSIMIADLQGKKFEEEQKRFQWGRSDTDTIIRFQEDWLRAQREAVLAKNNYFNALVDLRKKEGVLLQQHWEGEI